MDKVESVLHYHQAISQLEPMIATSAVMPPKTVPGRHMQLSFDEISHLLDFEKKYPELKTLKDIDAKRAFVRGKRDELKHEVANLDLELKTNEKNRERLDKRITTFKDADSWVESNPKIEKPDGISFRRLRKAVAEGRTVYLDRDLDAETPANDFEKEVFRFAEILMVEHDWAGALQKSDLVDAAVKIPYDVCAFEFKLSGRAVIALATQFETDIAFSLAIECADGFWLLAGFVSEARGMGGDQVHKWVKLYNTIGSQIRAACIALDAEVATSEVVREPYSSAHGKNAHQPLKPYHIISLAHRTARPLPMAAGAETGRRVRLHFRRGHWRHFEQHKTWIKWMLVGDPDLGFVDKHYKL